MKYAFLPLAGMALAGLSTAQVTPIGPFVGDRSEGFETQNSPGFPPCVVGRVFNGTADLCTPGSSGAHITVGWSFMCQMQEHSGSRLFGASSGVATYTFDNDIEAFGGYLGTNAWSPGSNEMVTVNFYDRQGGLIDSVIANVTDDCTWTWNGWSAPGIASIELINSAFGGSFVLMDDMEVLDSSSTGTTFCNSNPNSTGVEAQLAASGSSSLAANNLVLETTAMPLNSFAFYLTSSVPGFTPNPGGSQGNLCLGGAIGRYVGTGQIQNSGSAGMVSLPIGLTMIPQPMGFTSAAVGDTWHFQTWFRDANPSATSNFSSGIEVVITP